MCPVRRSRGLELERVEARCSIGFLLVFESNPREGDEPHPRDLPQGVTLNPVAWGRNGIRRGASREYGPQPSRRLSSRVLNIILAPIRAVGGELGDLAGHDRLLADEERVDGVAERWMSHPV